MKLNGTCIFSLNEIVYKGRRFHVYKGIYVYKGSYTENKMYVLIELLWLDLLSDAFKNKGISKERMDTVSACASGSYM